MTPRERLDRTSLARNEFAGAKLGDARLTARLGITAVSLAMRPEKGLPAIAGNDSALEATYRFLGNEKVTPEAILVPHIALTRQRSLAHENPLCIFDTTEVRLGGEREELGYLSHEKGRGFLAHIGLMVSPSDREPLGVIHSETVVRRGAKKNRKQANGAADSEALRWHRGAAAAFERVPNAICVMDREADIYALVAEMDGRGQRFVIRAAQNRTTPDGPLWDLLDDTELVTTRTLDLAEREPRNRRSDRKRHPPRSAHLATLELRVRRIRILHPNAARTKGPKWKDTEISLHLVHVIERDPPDGDPPVEWLLITNLPIASKREVDFVVDAYRARWMIEELFKALKSGCALEKRQLEGERSMTNMLAVSLPIAWLILRLRHVSRTEPERRATGLLSPTMLECLRILTIESKRPPLPASPTYKDITWAIAGLGGHIKNNGDPGFLVLGRGLETLIMAADIADALRRAGKM
jgi:hypothetical protein